MSAMGDSPRSAARLPWVSLDSAGFRAMLQAPVVARSGHFALHHETAPLQSAAAKLQGTVVQNLSTEPAPQRHQIVDNSANHVLRAAPVLGVMVPKRHAKRSVTRSLVKRQMRAAVQPLMQSTSGLAGTWLVRLRHPIDVKRYPSASSEALRQVLRAELDALVAQVGPRGSRQAPA